MNMNPLEIVEASQSVHKQKSEFPSHPQHPRPYELEIEDRHHQLPVYEENEDDRQIHVQERNVRDPILSAQQTIYINSNQDH